MRRDNGRTLTFEFPLPRTHTGVALGNGNMGALVWGQEPNRLNVTVSRNDFWDHRNGGLLREGGTYERLKAAYRSDAPNAMREVLSPGVEAVWRSGARASTLLPVGRFELCLRDDTVLRQAVLDCGTGCLRVVVDGSDATLKLVLSPIRNVLLVVDEGGLVGDVVGRPSWEWTEDEFLRRGFPAPERIADEGLVGWVQACPEDPALCALAKKTPEGVGIALSLGDRPEDAERSAREWVDEMAKQGKGAIREESRAWWNAYWSRVPEVEIPSRFFSRFLLYAHYKFGCATNPNSPRPAPLQGPWIEEYQFPPWGGDYTCNVNIEQIYTMTFCGQNLDHIHPLFDMLESKPFQEAMRHNARVLLGIDDGLLLTHTVNDLGRQCQVGFTPHSALDQAVAAWLAHLYWLYCMYTGDDVFLKERAYPFMLGVMRVFEEMLEDRDDGSLWLPVSVSPEYGVTGFKEHRQEGPNASMQLACIHMLANALTACCRVLGTEPRPIWKAIKARLPLFATVGESGEQERIAIWEGQDLAVCHRHHSHLASVYPFDLTGEMTERELEVVANAIAHWLRMGMGAWSEWCFPWAALIEARMGMSEGPYALLKIWRDVFINEGMATVYLPRFHGVTAHRYSDIDKLKETHEIMQLEGTAAGATALFEMLVHTHGGVTRVFPATPQAWVDVAFRRVPQPGGFLISASRRGGTTASVEVTSLRGGRLSLDVHDQEHMTLARGKATEAVGFPLDVELEAGECVRLRKTDGSAAEG